MLTQMLSTKIRRRSSFGRVWQFHAGNTLKLDVRRRDQVRRREFISRPGTFTFYMHITVSLTCGHWMISQGRTYTI